MKTVFMGTPDFAVKTLEAMIENGYAPELVVTQPDTARDRGKKIKYTPVKEKALEAGIEVLQPEKIRDNGEFMNRIRECAPDLIVVVAYGKLLPVELLEIPGKGCINVHASLLPRHRGAAPVQKAILDGDEKTGVTIMYVAEKLDAGDMIARSETPTDGKTAGQLLDELSVMGAELLVKTMPAIADGTAARERQREEDFTYAPMISRKDGLIDFSRAAADIERQIRAMDPWPGAYTLYQGETMKVWSAAVIDEDSQLAPGTITDAGSEGITVAAGKGKLVLKTIQVPGKKRVAAKDYLRGHSIEKSQVLG